MVPSIGRGACQNNIMILSAFHRHDGISSFSSTEVQDNPTATEQLHTSSPGPNNGIDIADEHDFSIISAMQVSERCGVYDPSRKFIYQTEQPVDLEQQQDDSADKKRLPGVDEKCRAKMLDWCAKVSCHASDLCPSLVISSLANTHLHYVLSYPMPIHTTASWLMIRWSTTLTLIEA